MEFKNRRVAVFPAGTEIGLELHRSLQYATWFSTYGISSVEDHSRLVYQEWSGEVPWIGEPDFLTRLNSVLQREHIQYLYPAHDDALLFLARHRRELSAELVACPVETVEITRSKRKTYSFFQGEPFLPRVYAKIDEVDTYPVFAKPDIGQGSQGARILQSRADYDGMSREGKDLVLCEYLPGKECTVDCFTDRKGRLLFAKMRSRNRMRNGISVDSRVEDLPQAVWDIAVAINGRLRFDGAWFFQIKQDNRGQWKLLEIAARIGGTSGLTRCLGVNLPLLTLYQAMGKQVDILENRLAMQVDRALVSRYRVDYPYQAVYVDLDDTLLSRDGGIHRIVLMFLYQAVGQGKRVILLTRHRGDLEKTLEKHCISQGLFHQVIQIGEGEKKSDAIKEQEAILIDDSFAERTEVSRSRHIPVFDVDAVECLIDWRT